MKKPKDLKCKFDSNHAYVTYPVGGCKLGIVSIKCEVVSLAEIYKLIAYLEKCAVYMDYNNEYNKKEVK